MLQGVLPARVTAPSPGAVACSADAALALEGTTSGLRRWCLLLLLLLGISHVAVLLCMRLLLGWLMALVAAGALAACHVPCCTTPLLCLKRPHAFC